MTHTLGGRTIYIVCDGHGPVGHVVAFRIAQSLPKFVLDTVETDNQGLPVENLISKAFDAANAELVDFANTWGLDLSRSGTTCGLVLRQGDGVHVAWLGDTRLLVATVVGEDSRVDLAKPAHSPSEPEERQRLLQNCANLRPDANLSLRVFSNEDEESPGLSVSRAFGNLAIDGMGVTCRPDLAKTSFQDIGGLVLIGSGGLFEFLGDGDASLETLLHQGQLMEGGAQHALTSVGDIAQCRWREQAGDYCEDITGLLLHWRADHLAGEPQPSSPSSPSCSSMHPHAVQAESTRTAQSLSPQAQPQRFLQAQPQRFLQAQPTVAREPVALQSSSLQSHAQPSTSHSSVMHAQVLRSTGQPQVLPAQSYITPQTQVVQAQPASAYQPRVVPVQPAAGTYAVAPGRTALGLPPVPE